MNSIKNSVATAVANTRIDPDQLAAHTDYLVAYAMRQVQDRDLAQDLVQDTLIAALASNAGFEGRSALRTWLVGILKHKIMDSYRDKARAPSSLDDLLDAGIEPDRDQFAATMPAIGMGSDPAKALEHTRFWAAFERELGRMPARMAEAFVLSELSDLDSAAVCKKLSITPNLLWVMRFRARDALRNGLSAAGIGPAIAA